MTGTYIQMASAFVFILLLIFAAMFILKKRQNKTGLMNIVGYQSLGPKKGVAALKIGGEVLMLGVTTNEIRLLKVYRENELDLSGTGAFRNKLEKFKNIEAHTN